MVSKGRANNNTVYFQSLKRPNAADPRKTGKNLLLFRFRNLP